MLSPSCSDNLFENEDNESEFNEICEQLKIHPFQSPWSSCFDKEDEEENKSCCVQEIHVPDEYLLKGSMSHLYDSMQSYDEEKDDQSSIPVEEKFLSLKKYFSSAQDIDEVEKFTDFDLLHSINLLEVPKLCDYIGDTMSNEVALCLFLKIISTLEKPLGVTVVAALVKRIIMANILTLKLSSYRNLCSSIISFFQVFPKVTIEEIIIPCLRYTSLDISLQEMVFKLVKNDMPKEYVICAIKSVLNEAVPSENTFTMLQNLIEKKIPLDAKVHNDLAFTLETWSSANNSKMKFIKLIISTLSTYGSELSELQLNIYADIIKGNKTIMKKAAENIFNKLKQA